MTKIHCLLSKRETSTSPEVGAELIAEGVEIVVSLAIGVLTFFVAERRLRAELRLEDNTEQAIQTLMSRGWALRSFDVIRHHIRGFDDDELRRLLVRSGAVAFSDPDVKELWGLLHIVLENLPDREKLESHGFDFDDITGLEHLLADQEKR